MFELQRVSKSYGARRVVDDLSLSVSRGEVLVLVGESGSGKTTTLKMINRLIEPTSGSIRIDGQDTRELPVHLLRRRIGYVFQAIGLFPHMTVEENIAVPLSLAGTEREAKRARVEELLHLVELESDLAGRMPSQLSGGQQQRVGVARALALAPELMLLDEPFGALDPLTRDRLQQTFVRLRRELALTALFVTHDLSEAILIGDRIGVMKEGRLIQIGTARELIDEPKDDYVVQLFETPRRHALAYRTLLEEPRA